MGGSDIYHVYAWPLKTSHRSLVLFLTRWLIGKDPKNLEEGTAIRGTGPGSLHDHMEGNPIKNDATGFCHKQEIHRYYIKLLRTGGLSATAASVTLSRTPSLTLGKLPGLSVPQLLIRKGAKMQIILTTISWN